MDDNSIMPFGRHKGSAMVAIPDEYLLWFWGENSTLYKRGDLSGETLLVMKYIDDSFEDLP